MPISDEVKEGLAHFEAHYRARLGATTMAATIALNENEHEFLALSDLLRTGNHPRIFHRGRKTEDVLVLTHGLSDSPYYVEAIGRRFFAQGVNVILPLLPAHGLKDPDKAMKDPELDSKWKATIDNAVAVAGQIGERISIGGFSTGGALGLNKILRQPESITGGLFLFSGAIDLGLVDEGARFEFLQSIVRLIDGKVKGIGPDPYKYPELPKSGGFELSQIIKENDRLWKNRALSQPVFAAHSIHDETVRIEGVLELLREHVDKGVAFIVSQKVSHSSLVLEHDIELDDVPGAADFEKPRSNPMFGWMMENAVQFFMTALR
jgi:pimeloyl-ACP methyl ester carboxylesterase